MFKFMESTVLGEFVPQKKQNKLLYWASLYIPCYNNVKNLNNSISRKQHNVNLSFFKNMNSNTDVTKLCVSLFSRVGGWGARNRPRLLHE